MGTGYAAGHLPRSSLRRHLGYAVSALDNAHIERARLGYIAPLADRCGRRRVSDVLPDRLSASAAQWCM